MAGACAVLLAAAAAGHLWTARADRVRRRQAQAAQQAEQRFIQQEEAANHLRQYQIDQLAGELSRLESAPQYHYELLLALSRSAPGPVVLESVTTQGAEFTITGRTEENAGSSIGSLSSFYRALAAPDLPWTLGAEPPGSSGSHFTLSGRFRVPPSLGSTAADPASRTPEAVARWASRLEAEKARFPLAVSFDAQIKQLASRWSVSSEPAAPSAGGEVRHYALAAAQASLDDWSDLVGTVRDLCAQPGLTIDRLTLTAAPDGAAVILQAGLDLSVRLRP